LNDVFIELLDDTGRYVVLDEKMKECQQDHPLSRWAKKVDGHWTSQVAVTGPTTSLPFVLKMIPITSVVEEETYELPYNNLQLHELMKVATDELHEHTITVADCYYSDSNTRKYMRENDCCYLFALNKSIY
jgi:hypothetical protein